MLGFSIFMNQEIADKQRVYIESMTQIGFQGIFTSMHIPEDDATKYRQRLTQLAKFAKDNKLDLMVDVSGEALERAGFDRGRPDELSELGVTGLRMDYHISNQDIAQLSKYLKISLNASTVTPKDISELQSWGADFTNLEAWHNYYPRPETGLDREWLWQKNRWLKEAGFTVQAFVAGDEDLRGPLYQGLPTLEEHRGMHPLAAALDLQRQLAVDLVYIGDGGLAKSSQRQFAAWLKDGILSLRAEVQGPRSFSWCQGEHVNRQDEARDVVRSAEARFREIPVIVPENTVARSLGSITVDNVDYPRYSGEIQICKGNLAADPRINVAGRVIAKDRPLIQQIKAGDKFTIERVEAE